MSNKQINFKLVSEIIRGQWMISENYCENILPFVHNVLNNFSGLDQAESDYNKFLGVEDGIAYLSVKDAITSSDYCGSLGGDSIANIITKLNSDTKVEGLIVLLDSPGGSVSAGATITDALKNFNKPKVSVVTGMAASGAYWIASNTDKIFVKNQFSELGSIGVFVSLIDSTKANEARGYKVINIYAEQSTEKNAEVTEALKGNDKLLKAKLTEVASLFIADISAQRPDIDKAATKGAMYLADKAIQMNLADAYGDIPEAVSYIKSENKTKFYI